MKILIIKSNQLYAIVDDDNGTFDDNYTLEIVDTVEADRRVSAAYETAEENK